MDLHEGTATVREALEFSAVLRQPAEFTKAERLAYVDEVLRLLDLVDVQDVLIEDGAGLGVERLKRVTVRPFLSNEEPQRNRMLTDL